MNSPILWATNKKRPLAAFFCSNFYLSVRGDCIYSVFYFNLTTIGLTGPIANYFNPGDVQVD